MTDDWGKVFVGLRYQPMLPAWTCESLIGLAQFGLREGDRRDYVYSKTMHKAANMLVRRLLASDCDSLCFVDSDAVFGTAALEELRSDPQGWEYDALQAFTVKRGWPPEPMFLTEWPDQPQGSARLRGVHLTTNLPLDADHVYPVDAVSLHFTLVRRAVFERLLEAEGPDYTFWFEYARDNGEDINFSLRARSIGARLGMSTRLKVGHVSEVVTGWDTMVDYYHRKFEIEMGAPPASLEHAARFFEARKQLSALVAEYTGEDPETVYQRANVGVLPVAEKWTRDHPQTPEQVRAFYGNTPEYFYDLIKWNTSPAYQGLLARLAGVHGERVLEIGGGLGTMAEFLATRGNQVHYYDVPGVLRDFAVWRFARLNGRVPSIEIVERWEMADADGAVYDRVIAVDVLEHIHPDEFDRICDGLALALRSGGVLFAHNNWSQMDGSYPQHFDHAACWAAFLERHSLRQVNELEWTKP